jgi:hypothetical protein
MRAENEEKNMECSQDIVRPMKEDVCDEEMYAMPTDMEML